MELIKRWFSYSDLVNILAWFDFQAFEIFKALNEGKLTPYNKISGKRYVDEKKLPRQKGIPILPDGCEIGLFQTKNLILNSIFKRSEVAEYLSTIISNDQLEELQQNFEKIIATPPAPQIEPQTGNYFKQNGKHWAIKFENEFAAHVDHVDGLLFIAHILNNPGNVISDQNLYNLAKGTPLNEGKHKMTISAAKADGLNIDVSPPQEVNDQKAQIEYIKEYKQLQHDLDNAESDLEKKEIEDRMEELLPFLTRRNIPKPEDKKAQANITRLLNRAYESIQRENMPELAKYLKDNIKTDDYGRRYVGPVVWVIEIKK